MRLVISTILLTLSLFGYSQSEYPMLLKIDTTTVCAFTIDQVDSINVMYVNLDECNQINDSLHKEIWLHETREARFGAFINEQDKKIELQSKEIAELSNQGVLYEKQAKRDRRKIRFLRAQRNVLAILVAVASVKIFLLK